MFNLWDDLFDFNRNLVGLEDLRRRMDRVLEGTAGGWRARGASPRFNIYDQGGAFVLTALVPGLSDKDVKITLNEDTLNVAGERKVTAPEGYAVHRQERPSLSFSRSVLLPAKVDPEKAKATVKDGVLTITLAKSAVAQPRQITVTSA